MKEFIKKYLLFRVDSETRSYIHKRIIERDMAVYIRTLIIIFFVQLLMIFSNFSKYNQTDLPKYLVIIGFNLGLMLTCVIVSFIFRKVRKSYKNSFVVFAIINLILINILCWGIAVSCIDSIVAPNIVTFTYVALTLAGLITLAPWIIILDLGVATLVLNLIIYYHPNTLWSNGTLINSISVFLLGSLLAIITFSRRIKALELEMENEKLNAHLSGASTTDELTGLRNRRFLSQTMSDNLTLGDKPAGIIMFDIDYFKMINDTYGHLSGDKILAKIGEITLKTRDYSYAVRYGGEEFLLFFESISKEELYDIAEYLRVIVKNTKFEVGDNTIIPVSISLGIASAKEEMTYNQLINAADTALYTSKKTGRNKTSIAE